MNNCDYLVAKDLIDANGYVKVKKQFKIVKSGVIMQPLTHLNIPYDIVISWLQKSVRLGIYEDALYCAYQIIKLDIHELNISGNTMFRSHLLNRLITIMSEDIGVADNIVEDIYNRYWKLYHNADINESDLAKTIAEMLWILCNAKKSRYTDWLIHIHEFGIDISKIDDNIFNQLSLVLDDDMEQEAISLLDFNIKEVQLLNNLYNHRTRKYGLLYFVHALVLSLDPIFKIKYDETNKINKIDWLKNFSFNMDVWNKNECVKPIPNEVIDKHTKWGTMYLGRGLYYFLTNSSRLNNWMPYKSEEYMREQLINYVDKIENIHPEVNYEERGYQTNLIKQVMGDISNPNKQTICLNMATGTGKTRTSYCIVTDYIREHKDALVMFVFPTLDILDQTVKVWQEMIENDKNLDRIFIGILSSKHYSYPRHKFNYEFIDDKEGITRFLGYSEKLVGKKILFSTYASLSRKKEQLDGLVEFTIYDEGHHLTPKTFISGKRIVLTATPSITNHYDSVIQYGIGDAINDGFLSPFKVVVLNDNPFDYICNNSQKIIVYSYRNAISKTLYDELNEEVYDIMKYYIDCYLSNRKEILKEFKSEARSIIFNCSIMGEGVDIPDCDAIYLHSGRKSHTGFVQSIGRCLRRHKNKEIATVYIPNDKDLALRLVHIKQLGWKPEIIYT